jgi:hypothetical protein
MMDFTINGQAANITLEHEENVGELLSSIEQWLQSADFSLSGIVIDGKEINSGDISETFSQKLDGIKSIDIKTSSQLELFMEALMHVSSYLSAYQLASFEDKKSIQNDWENGAAASFLKNRETALFSMLNGVFSGTGFSSIDAQSIIAERIRELLNPAEEIGNMANIVEDCAKHLEDLPLDLQTGKDSRAVETIQLFSGINEKLFRIIAVLEQQGINFEAVNVENQSFTTFFKDFNIALDELLSAYESKDSVLVGDLAEYELAPRLRLFYAAINNPVLFSA